MADSTRTIDVVSIGRSSLDLYSMDIGCPFEEIERFAAYVGGSSTNIAIGTHRLGLNTILMTAVGNDKVGDFILHYLNRERLNTEFITKIDKARTSAVILGIQPPDKFPLVYYRDNAADWHIHINDVDKIDFSNTSVVIISGTSLARDPSRSATIYAAEMAKRKGAKIVLDLDFRVDQWENPMFYGVETRAVLQYVDVVLGTEEELLACNCNASTHIDIAEQQISSPIIEGNVAEAIKEILNKGVETLIVKKGPEGALVVEHGEQHQVTGFPVKVLNVLGAGDAFAAGFIYGYISGWNSLNSVRFANACGAILVTKPGCSNFSPSLDEVSIFIKKYEHNNEK